MPKFSVSRRKPKSKKVDPDELHAMDVAIDDIDREMNGEKKPRKPRANPKAYIRKPVSGDTTETVIDYTHYRTVDALNILGDRERFIPVKDLTWEVPLVPEYVAPTLPVTHAALVNKLTGKHLPFHISFYGLTHDDLWQSPHGIVYIEQALKRHKLFDDYKAEPKK